MIVPSVNPGAFHEEVYSFSVSNSLTYEELVMFREREISRAVFHTVKKIGHNLARIEFDAWKSRGDVMGSYPELTIWSIRVRAWARAEEKVDDNK